MLTAVTCCDEAEVVGVLDDVRAAPAWHGCRRRGKAPVATWARGGGHRCDLGGAAARTSRTQRRSSSTPGQGRRRRKVDHELMAVLAMTCSEWCGSVTTLRRMSSALTTAAGKWWAAPRVPVAWPWWSGVARRGRGRGAWGRRLLGFGEGAGCFGVYRASGLGLPGAPSILDVRAQAGTRGPH